jgi:hypothetical protein
MSQRPDSQVVAALLAVLLATLLLLSGRAAAANPLTDREENESMDLVDSPEEQARKAAEIRHGIAIGGEAGRSREEAFYDRVARKVEPTGKGSLDRLSVYTDLIRRELVSDVRLFATDVQAAPTADGGVELTGYVMMSESREAARKLFEALGFRVDNQIEVLPSAELGTARFAFVNRPHSFAWDRVEKPREDITQAILANPVYLLKKVDAEHYLCAGWDGYIGYMAAADLHVVDAARFDAYQRGPRAILIESITPAGAPEGFFLPAGARLRVVAETTAAVTLETPDGLLFDAPRAAVIVRDGKPPRVVLDAIEAGRRLLGTDYKWGGKTRDGIDCSGFVQTAFATQGINLARDTYMQAYAGQLTATRWHTGNLRMGDLLFFVGGNGRIVHVAIYLEDGQFIESSGSVKLTSMNPAHPNYDERRTRQFCFAKRIIE